MEVLKRADTVSVEALITASQLRWAGHVLRMPDSRLPKAVFYGELCHGKRKRGRPKLRYRDVLKRHMKIGEIDYSNWETGKGKGTSVQERMALRSGANKANCRREEERSL